jgi:predicted PurR-regulated permease PerM
MSRLLSSKLPPRIASIPVSTLACIVVAVVVISALYFAREVLVPISLALLLSFILAPLVRLLQAWYFPRFVAVLTVALFAFAIIFALGTFMVSQVAQLANDLPGYQSTLRDKNPELAGGVGRCRPP